jgi:hypothetical protein
MAFPGQEIQHAGDHGLINGRVFGHDLAVDCIDNPVHDYAINNLVRRALINQWANQPFECEADFLKDVEKDTLASSVELRFHEPLSKEILALNRNLKKVVSTAVHKLLLKTDHGRLGFLIGKKVQTLNEPLKVFVVFAELLDFGQRTRDG